MRETISRLITGILLLSGGISVASGVTLPHDSLDYSRFRYRVDSSSVFKNRKARDSQKIDSIIETNNGENARHTKAFENPDAMLSIPSADIMGDLEAPDGEMWLYVGKFEYLEIPPHDNVIFTERLLQEYTFTIYDTDMNVLGTIKDKVHYKNGEKRAPLCELVPVVTRNFFNTDDGIELMVGVGINPAEGYGVHFHSYVYTLGGEKDENGYDQPIMIFNSLVGDIIEGPRSADGSDNFYFTFSGSGNIETRDESSFWDRLVARNSKYSVYARALDEKGPRQIHTFSVPVMQLPGDQESVPPIISVRRDDGVYFLLQKYKEPFYNRYDDPINADLTQREGNSLLIDIFKADQNGLTSVSSTEIPVELDPMPNANGDATCLFSYFSVGNLRYRGDILFDAPGTTEGKPDFIITRANYQPSSDGVVNSYFTYRNDGSLSNSLCLYSVGSRAMGDIEGFEPQQLFVVQDSFGYRYRFVDIYSGSTASEIDVNYYYEDESDSDVLSSNCDRTPDGDSYTYVFELRYPLVDDNENDILRFIHIAPDGSYKHTDYVNMGKGVAYAQSYLSTEALRPHVYSVSDAPAYMILVKRGQEDSYKKIEELMVAEAKTEENPDGVTLLRRGPKEESVLSSIVPEFAEDNHSGRLFVYYYDSPKSLLSLDIYGLPLNSGKGTVTEVYGSGESNLMISGDNVTAEGEINVFTIDGKQVATGYNKINIATLEKGIYIVASKSDSLKFVK